MNSSGNRNQYLFFGILILIGLAVLSIINPGSDIEYNSDNGEDEVQSSYSYDDFEIDNNGEISNRLEDANRQDGVNRFGRRYLAESYRSCLQAEFVCSENEQYFFDPYGCGCELLDFSNEQAETASDEGILPPKEEVFGEVYTSVYGEAIRLTQKDSIELDNGDVTWIREFVSDDSGTPEVIFDVYLAEKDVTYVYPVEEELIPYRIELVSSDYKTYAEMIVSRYIAESEPTE